MDVGGKNFRGIFYGSIVRFFFLFFIVKVVRMGGLGFDREGRVR